MIEPRPENSDDGRIVERLEVLGHMDESIDLVEEMNQERIRSNQQDYFQ